MIGWWIALPQAAFFNGDDKEPVSESAAVEDESALSSAFSRESVADAFAEEQPQRNSTAAFVELSSRLSDADSSEQQVTAVGAPAAATRTSAGRAKLRSDMQMKDAMQRAIKRSKAERQESKTAAPAGGWGKLRSAGLAAAIEKAKAEEAAAGVGGATPAATKPAPAAGWGQAQVGRCNGGCD